MKAVLLTEALRHSVGAPVGMGPAPPRPPQTEPRALGALGASALGCSTASSLGLGRQPGVVALVPGADRWVPGRPRHRPVLLLG